MTTKKLIYLSETKLDELRDQIESNIARYRDGNFLDLASQYGWEVESRSVSLDEMALATLDGVGRGVVTEARNSTAVYSALRGMTPSLAQEERVWVRLCHIEALDYSRSRWLKGSSDENLQRDILKHFFAAGRTGSRDDNALGRLWWNYHIARTALPDDPQKALRVILGKADTRLSLVERTAIGSRVPLLRNVIQIFESEKWLGESEDNFRRFMKVLNRDGGGILFETLDDGSISAFLGTCVAAAKTDLVKI